MERSLVIIQPEALAHEADILRHLSNKGFKILQVSSMITSVEFIFTNSPLKLRKKELN